jgi:hypothetical protein
MVIHAIVVFAVTNDIVEEWNIDIEVKRKRWNISISERTETN